MFAARRLSVEEHALAAESSDFCSLWLLFRKLFVTNFVSLVSPLPHCAAAMAAAGANAVGAAIAAALAGVGAGGGTGVGAGAGASAPSPSSLAASKAAAAATAAAGEAAGVRAAPRRDALAHARLRVRRHSWSRGAGPTWP